MVRIGDKFLSLAAISAGILGSVVLVGVLSAAPVTPLEPGSAAPTFAGLAATDGKKYGMDDFADAEILVLVFTGDECPIAVAYQDRLGEMAKQYRDQKVAFLAINVDASESLETMIAHLEGKSLSFPYVKDEEQKVSRAFGAKVTPHVFVLNAQREVAFVGPIDDNFVEAKVSKRYLADAIEAILAGKEPAITKKAAAGCSINYR